MKPSPRKLVVQGTGTDVQYAWKTGTDASFFPLLNDWRLSFQLSEDIEFTGQTTVGFSWEKLRLPQSISANLKQTEAPSN